MKNRNHIIKFIALIPLFLLFISCGKNPSGQNVTVFPNPAIDHINIHGEGMQHFTLFDINGQMVKDGADNIGVDFYQIEVGDLAPGTYLLQVTTTDGMVNKSISVIGFDAWND